MVCLPPGSRVPYLADPIHCSQQQWEAGIVIFIVQSRKWTHREVIRDLPEVTQRASSRAGLNSGFWPPSPH